ncbi:hypothetical protein JRI60_28265 [Archangium violaceum]|uniref:CIS tube protein n=1 Tax=Archangium violaceum TaxID=83451 RepID=UPI00194EFE62|nr:hypothetical protein [Archangium violaceum]QRN93099.1 hypothetical protein JRI60_28265 [Archangium violaceum]
MITPKPAPKPEPAKLLVQGREPIVAHFNPATLRLTLTTRLGQGKKGTKNEGQQVVNEGSAKLSVELIFDTTDTHKNVCDQTVAVARLLGEKNQPPPQTTFDWGAFAFTGIVDSYQETLDFFSVDGVPLRSTVAITMTKTKDIFSRGKPGKEAVGWSGGDSGGGGGSANQAAQVEAPPPGGSTTVTATQAGVPAAGRAIAAMNGEESMRFPRAPTLTVDASVQLAPPVAFTVPGASLSASASLGAGLGGGLSANASLGASFGATGGGASAGFNLSFGGGSSAGITASQGAFAGLRVSALVSSPTARLDTSRLVRNVETFTHAADGDAVFELGGRMKDQGSSLDERKRTRIRFEEK